MVWDCKVHRRKQTDFLMYEDDTETNQDFYVTMPQLNPQQHAYNEQLARDLPSL